MYTEFATDAKVQTMSESMQRRLIMLFCIRGIFGPKIDDKQVAYSLRLTPEELAETKALFTKLKFIGPDWNVRNWEARQKPSDHSKMRVRKHREAKKKAAANHDTDVPVTDVTVTVTGQRERKREESPPEILPPSELREESPTGTDTPTPLTGGSVCVPSRISPDTFDQIASILGDVNLAFRLSGAITGLDYPDGWVVEAARLAAATNKPSPPYIVGVLRNWQARGGPPTQPAFRGNPGDPPDRDAIGGRPGQPYVPSFPPDIEAIIRGEKH